MAAQPEYTTSESESLPNDDDQSEDDFESTDPESSIDRTCSGPVLPEKEKTDLMYKNLYKSKRFSPAVVAILNRYYNNGMCGVGKRYDCLISCAARETKLSILQIKVS